MKNVLFFPSDVKLFFSRIVLFFLEMYYFFLEMYYFFAKMYYKSGIFSLDPRCFFMYAHNSKNNVIWCSSKVDGGEMLEFCEEKFV